MLSKKLLVVALLILLGVGVGLYFVFRDNYKVKSDFGFQPVIDPVNIKFLYGECLYHCPTRRDNPTKSHECRKKCAKKAGLKKVPDYYGCLETCIDADSPRKKMICDNGCIHWHHNN